MTTTTMHFGPEWMRKQPTPSSRPSQTDPQPIIPAPAITHINATTAPPLGASTYSSLVTSAATAPPEDRDVTHPFRYSKEEMIRIYKEGGGRGGLGLEVERWEGIVREVSADPIGFKDPGESEKKLFIGSLNSEVRRRQSTDYLTPLATSGLDRPKLNHAGSSTGTSPMRERFGVLMGQRRRDSSDQPAPIIPRKQSISSLQGTLNSPREIGLPSPRSRSGPGFDGVLGSGESWVSRRRNSESRSVGTIARDQGGTNGQTDKASEIKEEVEETQNLDSGDKPQTTEQHSLTHPDPKPDISTENSSQQVQVSHANIPNQIIDDTGPNMTNGSGTAMTLTEEPAMKAPSPGLLNNTDLAGLEWSYLDVQGQVQGPFRADLMQSWYDQGYFTPDLLMKRTGIDLEWISVAELKRRATGPKVFLSPLIAASPPGLSGLSRRPDASNDALSQQRDASSLGNPYQPVPARSLRTSALDSFANGLSTQSDSPSSSFGAGRFGNGSPDPLAFGGRAGNNIFSAAEPTLASIGGVRRSTYAESSFDVATGRSPFTNAGPTRAATLDYTFNNIVAENALGGHLSFGKPTLARNPHDQNSAGSSPFLGYEVSSNIEVGSSFTNGPQAYSQGQPFSGSPSTQYAQHIAGSVGQPTVPMTPSMPQQPYAPSGTSQSPWNLAESSGVKRPGPFDPPHPTSRNTVVARQPSPWQLNPRAQWIAAQQESPSDTWAEGTSSLTFSNLEQHNQQQQQPDSTVSADENISPVTDMIGRHEPKLPQESTPDIVPTTSAPDVAHLAAPSSKSRRKSLQVKPPQPPAQVSKPPTPPVASPAPQLKAAWSKEDEAKKSKSSSVAIGIREIQEAESKRAEARKAAERERERVARSAASAPNEESSTFTASWGLPTSQVHSSRNNTSKDPPSGTSPNPATTSAPLVWTSVAKPPVTKKTMKEIQEEEERRKKVEASKEKESVGTVVRRAYAESTNKNAPVQPTGPAWTTVGVNGKTTAASTARPSTVVSSSSTLTPVGSSVVPRPMNGVVVTSPRPSSTPKSAVATPKTEEHHVNPSHDFLRWLGESLKGLNASVNLEDITSMLLSFPLDADSSTMEIISDLIYANSTTLDGRRFASEFVSKRKTDAASRPKGAAAPGVPGKPPSIAEVVKAQPKPVQNEWGGFKVVNKKKKSGRS